ncbi:alkyl hydroperoxide reductase subunit F [Listeria floridensis FSL S10-1187]|uniref:Alkyl hydroperoxide reductase subunit F n=1 Tax=Listeria floridensis FSL S10-1187 TaxID=1265817 RepID=A0ABP3AXC2_9LIST|nr:alkyl hydroperoxide reductase subunit F [Listeria floridensis]EUJ31004.1 alkyl hydroperoxide reductase subunit F [Listeria floridensis FSL S10-1187]
MLDAEIKKQLAQYLEMLENDIVLRVGLDSSDNSKKLSDFVQEITGMSPKISMIEGSFERLPSFSVDPKEGESGIVFSGIPLGHEFTSLVLALLQVGGRAPKVSEKVKKQILSIKQDLHFETYVSLSCHNCPDVVQALNIMSVLNPLVSHTMVEGGMFQKEIDAKNIMGVPTVFLNGEEFSNGRMTIEQILEKVVGGADISEFENKDPYDVLVIGGGPAGASAAIYAARKGIRTGLVAETFGGQVLETLGIENVIGTKYIEGPELMRTVEEHVNEYDVDVMKTVRTTKLEKNELVELTLNNGAVLKSKTAIVATGARWRNINVPGEKEFKNKGVAYCPHCDGPLFAGKNVAVIGGGNSGIEAAIDLAGLVNHVTVLEFMSELKADQVLQKRLYSLPNVTVLTNVQTKEITGTEKVNGVTYVNRETNEEVHLELEGVFILIGLVPNTEWLEGTVERTKMGEIIVDKRGASSLPGVFAAGDCTDSAYKQIIISMGSGATASLGAFDYLIRN